MNFKVFHDILNLNFCIRHSSLLHFLGQVDADEAMANAERDLKADAEWKRIQQNTFTRWANEHLKQADKQVSVLLHNVVKGRGPSAK